MIEPNLCVCGHDWRDHLYEGTNGLSDEIVECHHDKAFFKGMCCCSSFHEVDNLTHIEILAKQRGLV
jgi:hypothetical protein